MARAYYNEFDPGAAAWLRELIAAGLIADGDVDERSILDVRPAELSSYTQCHFFAGIGGWSLALRLAGWPDGRPVWTGSPPCQPFSAAGQQLGKDDPRHLAPHFISLVGACRPRVLFGEQVASSDVFGKAAKRARGNVVAPPQWAWLDDLSDRLEAARYAVGASDFPSAGVGAPHIRQRTFLGAVDLERLADTCSQRFDWQSVQLQQGGSVEAVLKASGGGDVIGMADSESSRRTDGSPINGSCSSVHGTPAEVERVGHRMPSGDPQSTGPLNSLWSGADWLFCRDGKWRPVESSVLGLAARIPAELVRSGSYVPASYPLAKGSKDARRVMRLRGYGNAINPWAAKEFIEAFTESIDAAAV